MQSSLLIREPKTFAYWWTFVPVLPLDRNDINYHVLRRQWADHTMNCIGEGPGGWRLKSGRGFYVEGREDHVTPVLFHIWAAIPNPSWVGSLLALLNIPHSTVRRVRWSYSWEQRRDGAARPDITDIVLCWEDDDGLAVLVVEAKRPGGSLSDKDREDGQKYLEMPSIRPFGRKYVAFLVDGHDLEAVRAAIPAGVPVLSWQEMGGLQADLVALHGAGANADLLRACVAKHYADLGMDFAPALHEALRGREYCGTSERYEAVIELGLPSTLERFLIGSEVTFCARTGRMPEPPYPWLAGEPSFPEVVAARGQTSADRARPLWRLPV